MQSSIGPSLNKASNDSVEFGGVVKRCVDHAQRWDFVHFFLLLLYELHSVSPRLPADPIFIVVHLDERHELVLLIDHKHLLHVFECKAGVCAFSRARDLVPDCIRKLVNEKVVQLQRHVVLLLQDFAVGALHKVVLQRHGHLDI